MSPRRRRVAAACTLALAATPALAATLAIAPFAPTALADPANPLLGAARLAGNFDLAGRVTTAVRIKGERKGQTVSRTWSFLPGCPIASCQTVGLLRRRAGGSDRVTLTRKRPGYYTGTGSFYVPLTCGGKLYRRGELAPFTITVTVTAALRDPTGTIVATRVNATYTNTQRRNLTKCVAFPGHDAASYHGHVIIGSSSGGTGGTGVG